MSIVDHLREQPDLTPVAPAYAHREVAAKRERRETILLGVLFIAVVLAMLAGFIYLTGEAYDHTFQCGPYENQSENQ
jgi:hypothetical protein